MTKRSISDRMRRLAEADFYKLMGGRISSKPKQARDLVDELMSEGLSTRAAARVACAAEADDPRACAKPIADKPRPSVPRATAKPFEAPPVWTKSPDHERKPVKRLASQSVSFQPSPDFVWKSAEQVNSFLLVTGSSGSGKSVALKSLAQQLAPQVPVLLFDVHGDLAVDGVRTIPLGKVGINPLDAFESTVADKARSFVSAVRLAVPTVGSVQALILSETVRDLCARGQCSLPAIKAALEARRVTKGADHSSLVGLLASLDVLFGDPVFSSPHSLHLRDLLTGSTRLDLTALTRPAQVLVIDTVLRWIFSTIRQLGPVEGAGQLRLMAVADEAKLLRGSELLDLIFREARKFGMGFALASQLAEDFSPALRANAATVITLRAGSAREISSNARDLGLNPSQVAKLTRPGQALWKDSTGLHTVQIQPFPFAQHSVEHAAQLAIGERVELEHTKDPAVARRIAEDHLREIPDYYTRLVKMESKAKRSAKRDDRQALLPFEGKR
jgi:energy-coupling factor transporter ATP-binding protein EcfA2